MSCRYYSGNILDPSWLYSPIVLAQGLQPWPTCSGPTSFTSSILFCILVSVPLAPVSHSGPWSPAHLSGALGSLALVSPFSDSRALALPFIRQGCSFYCSVPWGPHHRQGCLCILQPPGSLTQVRKFWYFSALLPQQSSMQGASWSPLWPQCHPNSHNPVLQFQLKYNKNTSGFMPSCKSYPTLGSDLQVLMGAYQTASCSTSPCRRTAPCSMQDQTNSFAFGAGLIFPGALPFPVRWLPNQAQRFPLGLDGQLAPPCCSLTQFLAAFTVRLFGICPKIANLLQHR